MRVHAIRRADPPLDVEVIILAIRGFNPVLHLFFFFLQILNFLEDIRLFRGATDTLVFGLPVMSALGFKATVDPLACMLSRLLTTDSSDSPLVRHLPFPPIWVYTV